MTIETVPQSASLPDDVFEEIKNATSSSRTYGLPRVPASRGRTWYPQNSLLRRGLELFPRPSPSIKIPERTLTGPSSVRTLRVKYIWGNKGIQVNDDLAG